MTRCPAVLLPGLSVAVPTAALKIIPCISRVPFGALSAIWPLSICSVDQWRNPNPHVSVLLGVRHRRHSPDILKVSCSMALPGPSALARSDGVRLWAATAAQCGEHAAFQRGREHEGTLSTPWCSPAAGLARGAGLFIALSLAVPLCVLDVC